jgi:class 3 adenylate cyclase
MGLGDDLRSEVVQTFKSQWSSRNGRVVPIETDLQLTNDTVHFNQATILYADLSGSTKMVDNSPWELAAEVYKSFLQCSARVIRQNGGEITSYDGDRIMAVYVKKNRNSAAARTALQINYCVEKIINPALQSEYKTTYAIRHRVGIDTSEVRVARTGIRGANDLVWVGRAPNYAAKLSDSSTAFSSWITKDVYDQLTDEIKFSKGRNVWEERRWKQTGLTVYGSTWHLRI